MNVGIAILSLLSTSFIAIASAASSNNAVSVVCVAGQCIEGFSNLSIGAQLTSPSNPALVLLPGEYSTSSNPQLLHQALTANGASISGQTGFGNTTLSLPLNVQLQPGVVTYNQALYSGQSFFVEIPSAPSNISSGSQNVPNNPPIPSGSLAISANTWAVLNTSGNARVVVWDSIPDYSQLPSSSSFSSMTLLDVQSAACSPPCSSSGICSSSGTCTCPEGFTGPSCETCASSFFGPSCKACPANCTTCDDGPTGTGICLSPTISNEPSTCNCVNGVCDGHGGCTCNAGWTTAQNGTLCSTCSPGFFLDNNGNCEVCQLGCSQCSNGSGDCLACASGFTGDGTDRTKCDPIPATTSNGQQCADGSFPSGTSCTQCSPLCKTCTGATSDDCIVCASGSFKLNGICVPADGNGICANSTMIGNGPKESCDACPAKCTACGIPNFTPFSLVTDAKCTGCIPGFVLSNGQCVETCPNGTFLNPKDNVTCTACSSSCQTCAGSANFCLSCANNQLASNGQCVASCPSSSFSSSGSCLSCHPDCATCTGSAFNQCTACPPSNPVLTNGRCLPTCSKNQFFESTSSSCSSCDSSCASCSGPGSSGCLSCANSNQVLKGGTCVTASCSTNATVVSGLGVCLDELVSIPTPSSGSAIPLPSITGISQPTVPDTAKSRLPWWQILLMVLGCCFIFGVIMMIWRRRAVKKRKAQIREFALKRELDQGGWMRRLKRFTDLFRARKRKQAGVIALKGSDHGSVKRDSSDQERLVDIRRREMERHDREMTRLGLAYEQMRAQSRSGSRSGHSSRSHSRAGSAVESIHEYENDRRRHPMPDSRPASRPSSWLEFDGYERRGTSVPSIYSKATGHPPPSYHYPRRTAEPKTTMKNADADLDILLNNRFSVNTMSSSAIIDLLNDRGHSHSNGRTEAQNYMMEVTSLQAGVPQMTSNIKGSYWLTPTPTGGSSETRNPFRK